MTEVLTILDVAGTLSEAGVRKTYDVLMFLSMTRSYADLELLICAGVWRHTLS